MIVRAMRSPYCLRSASIELKILASFLVRKTISTVESHLIYLIGNNLSAPVWGRKWYLTEGGKHAKPTPALRATPPKRGWGRALLCRTGQSLDSQEERGYTKGTFNLAPRG